MKNSFPRFVFAALLSTAAGTVFAGLNPKLSNSEGANQKNMQCYAPGLGKDPLDMNCHERNVYRANMNSGVPKTLAEMEEAVRNHKYSEYAPEHSIYHNLKEPSPLETMSEAERVEAYSLNGVIRDEWKKLEKLREEHPNWTPEQFEDAFAFRFLDPALPNRKFVSSDGKMEAVYNRNTGVLVDTGINQGTYNLYNPKSIHFFQHMKYDSDDAAICGAKVNEERSIGEGVSIDDLKNMNLDDKNGDWCQCANPGCVNTFKVVNGKHEGYLTFVCSHCKKVNVGFAREALKYEGIIKGEGGTPQWFGPNAEANAKAAGNAK